VLVQETTQELPVSFSSDVDLLCIFASGLSLASMPPNVGRAMFSVSGSTVPGVDLAEGGGRMSRRCSSCDCRDSRNGR
jgi:hypothetical protein